LESGRGLSLLRQAHVEGRIDLRDADPYDRSWWQKVVWTLDWVDQLNRNKISELKHQLHCGLLDYLAGQDAINLHWEQATKTQKQVINSLFPWQGVGPEPELIEAMTDQWRGIYGHENDPKVQAEIDKTVKHLLNMASKNRMRRPR